MSRYYGGWAPYVPVAERRRKAERAMAKLRKSGHPVAPVSIAGRRIATTFWGRAWCDNLEAYGDYENRLPRGRTYVRNGSVVDLQIAPGRIAAMVSGSDLYTVAITIKETAKAHWRRICADCAGGIDSLVELLQGRFSQGVMERLCRQEAGLFPGPADIRFSCSCPDHASMCKHVAAVLYGVGARLDHTPELLFRLRAVDETDLVAGIDTALPLSKTGPAAGRVLETDDISALFGLDMAASDAPAAGAPSGKPGAARARRTPAPAAPKHAPAGMPPAGTGPTRTSTTSKNNPVKPAVARRNPAAAKATPAKIPAQRQAVTAKTSSRRVVPAQAIAVAEVVGKRQKSGETRARADTEHRAEANLASISEALGMPARGHERRLASKDKAAAISNSKPKPVKWW